MKYNTHYPGIADLKIKAKKRMPKFAFDYIDGGIDEELGKQRNRQAFHDIQLTPRYLRNVANTNTDTSLFGHQYSLPIGIPPIGLGNMMWPGSETALATAAQHANIPYILSTYSTTALEEIARLAPDVCWFQLYVPSKEQIMEDLIKRAKQAGYKALVITLDIPVLAKRNRELKNGLQLPFKITPSMLWQSIIRPQWTCSTLLSGFPSFVNLLPYQEQGQDSGDFMANFMMPGITKERIKRIRQLWDGPLVLKGVQHKHDIFEAIELGVDGIIISNHGGRQLDAAPSSVDSLQQISTESFQQIGEKLTLMIDSGVRTGLDVVRAKAIGAQASFSGRSFFFGMGAMGKHGASQVIEIYRDEITRTLQQLGCSSFSQMNSTWLKKT